MMFSIVCPVYNAEKTLHASIDSVLKQTFEKWELILVDDGSTDCSGFVCDDYSKKDSRIITLHQKNKGQMVARLEGISKATGDYVLFIDSDDFLKPTCLQVLKDKINAFQNPDTIVFNAEESYCDDLFHHGKLPKITNEQLIDNCNDALTSLFGNDIFGYLWMYCFEKSFLIQHLSQCPDFRLIRYTEDLLFLFHIVRYTKRTLFIPNVLYIYVQNLGSITHNLTTTDRKDRFEVYDYVYSACFNSNIKISDCVANKIIWSMISYLEHVAFTKTRKDFKKSFNQVAVSSTFKNIVCTFSFKEKYPSYIIRLIRAKMANILYLLIKTRKHEKNN